MEGFTLSTQLKNYKFFPNGHVGPEINITWYYFDEPAQAGRYFTDTELKQFENWTLKVDNFNGGKDYHNAKFMEEPPIITEDDFLDDSEQSSGYILKCTPKLSRTGRTDFMEIILTDTRGIPRSHDSLPFDVIGVIKRTR